MKHISYPSIDQFRHVVKELVNHFRYSGKDENGNPIYDQDKPLPETVEFFGTVKLHGTNASFVIKDSEISYQSRTSILNEKSDNAGFCSFFSIPERKEAILNLDKEYRNINNISNDEVLVYFGEWCGGNIQKGVALNKLTKRFVLFGIKHYVDEENSNWLNFENVRNHDIDFYNILDCKTYSLTLNLKYPSASVSYIENLTKEVEEECPFSKQFGISGLGEGIVWITTQNGKNFRFKSKGDKHSVVAKKPKDPLEPEKLNSINEFVNYTVTENRLNQAIEQVFTSKSLEPDVKGTGLFLKWLVADIMKEESDTLSANGLVSKDVTGELSKKGREWYFEYLNKNLS